MLKISNELMCSLNLNFICTDIDFESAELYQIYFNKFEIVQLPNINICLPHFLDTLRETQIKHTLHLTISKGDIEHVFFKQQFKNLMVIKTERQHIFIDLPMTDLFEFVNQTNRVVKLKSFW